MPSVTGALKNLKSKGMIEYEKNSFINLTEQGKEIAEIVLKKHMILVNFLSEGLLLSPAKAEEEACRIEHSIDLETARRIKNVTRYLSGQFSGDSDSLEKILS